MNSPKTANEKCTFGDEKSTKQNEGGNKNREKKNLFFT